MKKSIPFAKERDDPSLFIKGWDDFSLNSI